MTFPGRSRRAGGAAGPGLSALAVLVIAGACESESPPSLDWCEPAAGEPVSLITTGVSSWQREGVALRFTEVWRRGGSRPGENLTFPFAMAVSPIHGKIAIADFQLGEAIVVGADGGWEGSWTRSGSGPGEVRAPLGVAWDSAGFLLVYDIGRHVLIRLAGPDSLESERAVPPSFGGPVFRAGGFTWAATRSDGTLFLEPLPERIADGSAAVVRMLRWSPQAARTDTLLTDTVALVPGQNVDLPIPGAPLPLVATSNDGRLAIASDAHFRIRMSGPDDTPIRTLCREVEPIPLSPQETGEAPIGNAVEGPEAERLMAAIRAAPRPDPPAAIGRMIFGADGRLWVQRHRPAPRNPEDRYFGVSGARWDVYDAGGEWLGEAVAPPAARLMAVTADTAFALEQSADGELWLIALRMDLTPM